VWHSGQSEICIHLLKLWPFYPVDGDDDDDDDDDDSSPFTKVSSRKILLYFDALGFLCTVRQHENPLTCVECVLDKPWC
jgi:hypothetical protein